MSPGFKIAAGDPFTAPWSRGMSWPWACWAMVLTPARCMRQGRGLLSQPWLKRKCQLSPLRKAAPSQGLCPRLNGAAIASVLQCFLGTALPGAVRQCDSAWSDCKYTVFLWKEKNNLNKKISWTAHFLYSLYFLYVCVCVHVHVCVMNNTAWI